MAIFDEIKPYMAQWPYQKIFSRKNKYFKKQLKAILKIQMRDLFFCE